MPSFSSTISRFVERDEAAIPFAPSNDSGNVVAERPALASFVYSARLR